MAEGLTLPGFVARFDRNEKIFGEEEPAVFAYRVVSGTVRYTRVLSDGRRLIGAFHTTGDVFGLECGERRVYAAEAVSDCRIALVRRSALQRAAEADGAASTALWRLASEDLRRLQDHLLLLGLKSATERVAGFLFGMAKRTADGHAVDPPISLVDIGDYLGLTIGAISRALTTLARERAI